MARKKQTSEEPREDLMRWLLTYADMITLLLLFFIILYAISNVNQAQYQSISQELATVFSEGNLGALFDQSQAGGQGLLEGVKPGQQVESNRGGSKTGFGGQSTLNTQAVSALQNLIKGGKVRVITTERGLTISLESDSYFGPASADLGQEAIPVLQQVAGFLAQLSNSIVVEGHTDSTPVDGVKWKSNWELSAARAITVLQVLEDFSVPSARMAATAYGSTRPLVSDDTPEGRAFNRRVDIVIMEP